MKARQLIENAPYGPDELKAIWQACDEAWSAIEGNFGDDQQIRETARTKLAKAILSVASEGASDPTALRTGGLAIMALAYRTPELERPS